MLLVVTLYKNSNDVTLKIYYVNSEHLDVGVVKGLCHLVLVSSAIAVMIVI
jgi:hypothetical protein